MGNHDLMFIDYLSGKTLDPFNYYRNGERETFADFGIEQHLLKAGGKWRQFIIQTNSQQMLILLCG